MFFNEGGNRGESIPSHIIEVSGEDNDFEERLMSQKEIPPPEEIDEYVTKLIEKIRRLAKEKEKIALIKNMIQEGDIFTITELEDQPTTVLLEKVLDQNVIFDHQPEIEPKDYYDYENRVEQVRQLVLDKLKKQLAHDKELAHLSAQDIHQVGTNVDDREHLLHISDLGNKKHILRRDRLPDLTSRPEDAEVHRQALKKLITLPVNEYILNYKRYSPEDQKGFVERLRLYNLDDLLHEKSSSVVEMLEIIRDCMRGAFFLQEHDLVLQDICPNNLGYTLQQDDSKKGILFDLEGLYKAYAKRKGRFGNLGISPQNTSGIPDYYPPEAAMRSISTVTPLEMVYQFGQCLQEIVESPAFKRLLKTNEGSKKALSRMFTGGVKSKDILEEVTSLIQEMKTFNRTARNPTEKRISLSDALVKIDEVLYKIRNISS